MKILKSVLGMIVVLCLMMCLAVPAFATEVTDTTTAATTGDTTTEATTGDATTDSEDTVADGAEDVIDESEEIIEEIEEESAAETTEDTTVTEDKNNVLRTILLVLEVIVSVALILVVLLQSGKESGLGNTISGNSNSYMSKNKNANLDKLLASATKWIALAWIVFTLLLGLI